MIKSLLESLFESGRVLTSCTNPEKSQVNRRVLASESVVRMYVCINTSVIISCLTSNIFSFFFTGSQVEIYNRLGTAPVSEKDLQCWCGTGLVLARTAYHRVGWKFSISTGAVLDIGTMPSLKSVLVQYWHYFEVGC